MGAVGWEQHGSSPTTCAGKADRGLVYVCPLALTTLHSKFFEILMFVFLSEVALKSFCVKFSGLISKLKILLYSSPRIFNVQTYLWCANETPNYFA